MTKGAASPVSISSSNGDSDPHSGKIDLAQISTGSGTLPRVLGDGCLKTYTLYFRKDGEEPVSAPVEPALCASDAEAFQEARRRLAARTEFDSVEVCFGDDLLFNIRRR